MLNSTSPYQSQRGGALHKILSVLTRSVSRGQATARPWHGILKAAALLFCLALHGQSFGATFSCTPSAGTLDFTAPTGTYGVPRDTPVGTHQNKEFAGPGTYTSSPGFNIALNNCPAGMTSVSYRIDAVTPALDAANSVVSLDASSTASGIGVQLLDHSGNVFRWGPPRS
ncbi:fimbrial protein [Cupriavidus necator]|uniref:fimbrial protein n=1 Tax=Cupriavidus necator TaxID=106590 RepID=UPI000B211A9E|nr:type 1 fimbrial protein [Cupriavidus necator]